MLRKQFRRIALTLALALPVPAMADGLSGAYLAARQASIVGDYEAAAQYFTIALTRDPSNPVLLESAALAHVALGQLDRAVPIARQMEATENLSQVAAMVMMAHEVAAGDHQAVLTRFEQERGFGVLVDGLVGAWAQVGLGNADAATQQLGELATQQGLEGLALYQKALVLAHVGDFAGAGAIFESEFGNHLLSTRRGALTFVQILSQLDRQDDALNFLMDAFSGELDQELKQIQSALLTGQPIAFSTVTSPSDGVAEVFYTIASVLSNDADADLALMYSRVAEYLRPDHIDAILVTASLLEDAERYELAIKAYKRVPREHSAFHVAELGRIGALRAAGKTDAALEALDQMAVSHENLPQVHSTKGDLLRSLQRFQEAVPAYNRALELTAEDDRSRWFYYYTRAICYERMGQWDKAEPDFRSALEIVPNQPTVLNYLGYSLVEQQVKLDEALDMIERAVEADPTSGYIIDSLGWVYFRLGRYEEAVGQMERATELMPIDPIVNDHLGDVYWAVGRYREAEFQWKRALSFVDHEDASGEVDPDRIRRKIEFGLDQVLEEEGAEPLHLVKDDG